MEHPLPPIRLDYNAMGPAYRITVENKFETLLQCEEDKSAEKLWNEGKEIIIGTAKEKIPKKKRKKSQWISEETSLAVEERRKQKARGIHNQVDEANYRRQNANVQRLMRRDKQNQFEEQCRKVEENALINSTKDLYKGVKSLTGRFKASADTIEAEDGTVPCDGKEVCNRWKEYCSELYKKNDTITSTQIDWTNQKEEPPPLTEGVREAINGLKNDKSPGNDEIIAEMIKSRGKHTVSYFHKLYSKRWMEKKWPEDWINSVFVPIPKKGDTLQCNNNRMIALICHSSKILLKIIANRMKKNLKTKIAEEQAGFRPGTGTRNQILNLKMVIEKCREHNKKLYLCIIDYSKAFDKVDHNVLWRNMSDTGFPQHIVLLLKTMYEEQKAAVRTSYGLTEWFGIGQGVRQGYISTEASR